MNHRSNRNIFKFFRNNILLNGYSVQSTKVMGKKYDKYCWECCEKETTLKCSTCIRSFHIGCVTDENTVDDIEFDNWCCPVCNKLKISMNTASELKRVPAIIDRICHSEFIDLNKKRSGKRNAKRMKFIEQAEIDSFVANDDIVNPIDLRKIKEKANSYMSFDEFYVDVQWFVHNCQVLYTDNHDKTRRAKKLLNLVFAEIESVKTCLQCHVNANEKHTRSRWFTMVCGMPHLIIWAYRKNARYWPAKVMSIKGQQVNVRFFGSYHKHETVPTNKCFLYSENSPGNIRNANTKDKEFKSAIKEADQYIENLREKYGIFELAESKTPFDPALYDDYIRDLISRITTSPNNLTTQHHENNANNSDDLMKFTPGDLYTSFKSEASIAIDDVFETLSVPSDGQFENIEEETRGELDTDENMDSDENESTSIDNDLETSITEGDMDSMDISDYKRSFEYCTKGFDRICKTNAELKKRLLESEKNRNSEVEKLKETNTKLVAKNEQLQNDTKTQIEALKKTHEQEIAQLKEEHQRQIEEKKQAMEQSMACLRRCLGHVSN